MRITEGWLDVALDGHYGSKSMSRQGYKPTMIVLHATAGGSSAQAIDNYFSTSDVQASAHFIIGQDGTIVQGIGCDQASWSNGTLTPGHAPFLPQSINPNLYTISIEHVKSSTDNSNQLTERQQDASFKLIECLCNTYNIPKRPADANGGVLTHADFDPVNRSRCPGPYPHDQLYAYLNRSKNTMAVDVNDPVMQYYFDQDGDRLVRKNRPAVYIFGGIKQLYLQMGGVVILGLPISCEQYLQQYPGTAYLLCERVIVVFDPGRKIDNPPVPKDWAGYLMHIDEGIGQQLLVQQAAPLQEQLTAAQNKLKQIAQIAQS